MPVLQLTLAIIKPHIIKNPISLEAIRKIIISSNFKIITSKKKLLMGPTKVYKAQFEAPNTIRDLYGLPDTRNATHESMVSALNLIESVKRDWGRWSKHES
ncbi:hypothetical protein ABEB36_010027 [Hypothenemus hampei]|uniref:Nucleoside diphosphate kinase-like domain-containing protein n=1 Tax=Hypothenemus hampei TaxID=57062 RepID=A0ABD1EID3_HYPHA